MNAHATVPHIEVESTLAAVLDRLEGHDDKTLSIAYGDREVQSGFHVTEVKASSLQTLDCGGNPDAWQETVLQVEDIAATDDRPQMTAGKFRSILTQVDRKVRLNRDARLTIEIGMPGEAMRIFDVADVGIRDGIAVISLRMRPAICKPRHRAEAALSCCSSSSVSAKCC